MGKMNGWMDNIEQVLKSGFDRKCRNNKWHAMESVEDEVYSIILSADELLSIESIIREYQQYLGSNDGPILSKWFSLAKDKSFYFGGKVYQRPGDYEIGLDTIYYPTSITEREQVFVDCCTDDDDTSDVHIADEIDAGMIIDGETFVRLWWD